MKVSGLRVLAGMSVPLISTATVFGGYLGVSVTSARYPGPVIVFSMYAEFDRPDPGDGSGDHMRWVAGTPNAPLNIEVGGGTFYNHPFGSDYAPSAAFVSFFPSLAHDTFVTLGIQMVGDPDEFPGAQPADTLTITPGFPIGITGSSLSGTTFGWAIIPTAPQGDPFNPPFSYPGDGRLLIGRFSTKEGTVLTGTMLLGYVSNGNSGASIEVFEHHHCEEVDTDGDGFVGVVDMLDVLADWDCAGPDCLGDVSGDGFVNIRDFLDVFVFWGPCPG